MILSSSYIFTLIKSRLINVLYHDCTSGEDAGFYVTNVLYRYRYTNIQINILTEVLQRLKKLYKHLTFKIVLERCNEHEHDFFITCYVLWHGLCNIPNFYDRKYIIREYFTT